jgi:hypothetical protein
MSDQKSDIETDAAETPDISVREMTWTQTVEAFEREAVWLTGADRPQLKALYAIAGELDGGSFQTAMISQFTLVQRQLQARRPAPEKSGPQSESDQVLAMFENNPGVWKA